MSATPKVIGEVVRYVADPVGDDHPYLDGHDVRVIAVLRPPTSGNPDDMAIFKTDTEVATEGGVHVGGKLDVQPWIPDDGGGHYSFVSSDVQASLPCFDHLRID